MSLIFLVVVSSDTITTRDMKLHVHSQCHEFKKLFPRDVPPDPAITQQTLQEEDYHKVI